MDRLLRGREDVPGTEVGGGRSKEGARWGELGGAGGWVARRFGAGQCADAELRVTNARGTCRGARGGRAGRVGPGRHT